MDIETFVGIAAIGAIGGLTIGWFLGNLASKPNQTQNRPEPEINDCRECKHFRNHRIFGDCWHPTIVRRHAGKSVPASVIRAEYSKGVRGDFCTLWWSVKELDRDAILDDPRREP